MSRSHPVRSRFLISRSGAEDMLVVRGEWIYAFAGSLMDVAYPTLKCDHLSPTAAQLFERLPRTFRRHRFIKASMALTGEDPLQLVRVRDRFFGYAD